MTGGIGVDDAAGAIDEKHSRAQSVKRIGQLRRFGFCVLQQPADQYRTTKVWQQEVHPVPRFVVYQTITVVTCHSKHRDTCSGLLEYSVCGIHYLLRAHPLLVKARLNQFLATYEIFHTDYVANVSKKLAMRRRIELNVLGKIHFPEIWTDTHFIEDLPCLFRGVL